MSEHFADLTPKQLDAVRFIYRSTGSKLKRWVLVQYQPKRSYAARDSKVADVRVSTATLKQLITQGAIEVRTASYRTWAVPGSGKAARHVTEVQARLNPRWVSEAKQCGVAL